MGLLMLMMVGLLYFNVITAASNSQLLVQLEELQAEIENSKAQIGDISSAVLNYKAKTQGISTLAKEYNSEIEYLSSLEIINTSSATHNIRIDEILPRLENTLPEQQTELTDPVHTVERYAIDLRVDGRFLNIGRLLEDLNDNDFILRDFEFQTKSGEYNVKAIIGLYSYRLIAK